MKTIEEKELREYILEEWVNSGFIEVHQWRNFLDYLNIFIKKKEDLARADERIKLKRILNLISAKFGARETLLALGEFKEELEE